MKRVSDKYRLLFFICFLLIVLLVPACENNPENASPLKNGYYTAEMDDFDFEGWKEFISIYVNNGHIATVEYNAKNSSGFIKSWDPNYMREMNSIKNIYPNKYRREYTFALLNYQTVDRIDALSGATRSYHSFISLAKAAIEQAKKGAKQIALVKQPYKTKP